VPYLYFVRDAKGVGLVYRNFLHGGRKSDLQEMLYDPFTPDRQRLLEYSEASVSSLRRRLAMFLPVRCHLYQAMFIF
jgi:hypothetical protein